MRRLFWTLFVIFVAAPVLLLLIFRFVPLPGTPEMVWSLIQGRGAHYAWSADVAPFLGKAVIGAEDQNFCHHHGFDWKSIRPFRRMNAIPAGGCVAPAPFRNRRPAPCSCCR